MIGVIYHKILKVIDEKNFGGKSQLFSSAEALVLIHYF